MSTLTIPISSELDSFIEHFVRLGKASSKADLVRRAIIQFKEDEFIKTIQQAKREIKEGKALTGDLDTLVAGFE